MKNKHVGREPRIGQVQEYGVEKKPKAVKGEEGFGWDPGVHFNVPKKIIQVNISSELFFNLERIG